MTLLRKQERILLTPPDKITNPAVLFEFFPHIVLDLYLFIFLISRRKKIKEAGHILHKEFPSTLKIKMTFITLWILATLAQITLSLVSFYTNERIWIQ